MKKKKYESGETRKRKNEIVKKRFTRNRKRIGTICLAAISPRNCKRNLTGGTKHKSEEEKKTPV
ncbi:unnamed protein product [Camellia sinensis]